MKDDKQGRQAALQMEDSLRLIPCAKQEIIHSLQTRCTSGGVHGCFPAKNIEH